MLTLVRCVATIQFQSPAHLPPWKGNALRGAIGARLRSLVCSASKRQKCDACLSYRRSTCPYYLLYEAPAPRSSRYLSRLEGVPRPFVIEDTPLKKDAYESGETASFIFSLFGERIELLPDFIAAIESLGRTGWSLAYKKGLGQFKLLQINAVEIDGRTTTVYEDGNLYGKIPVTTFRKILAHARAHTKSLKLVFLTPTQIKSGGRPTVKPSFRTLLARLLFRLNALATYYCGNNPQISNEKVESMLSDAEKIVLEDSVVHIIPQFSRFSHDLGETKHPMFFTGELQYAGKFSKEIMAVLLTGTLIHIGKFAAFGCGKYEIANYRGSL